MIGIMRRYVIPGTSALLLLTGCATPGGTVGASASGSELSKTFGACPDNVEADGVEPLDYLSSLTPWLQIADLRGVKHHDGDVQAVEYTDSEGVNRSALMTDAQLAGVEWGIENRALVWIGIQSGGTATYDYDNVGTPMVFANNDVFFPGRCADELLYDPVHGSLGDQTYDILLQVTGSSPAESEELLQPEETVSRSTEPPVILNPESAPAGLLESLRGASIHLTVANGSSLEDGTSICTHIPEGWNDCVPVGLAREGVDFGGYVGADGVLEFWLMDSAATLTSPLGFLGSVEVGNEKNPVVNVTLDAEALDPGSLPKESEKGGDGLVRLDNAR